MRIKLPYPACASVSNVLKPLLPIGMASFSDSPIEVAADMVEALQDDLTVSKESDRSGVRIVVPFIFFSLHRTRPSTECHTDRSIFPFPQPQLKQENITGSHVSNTILWR